MPTVLQARVRFGEYNQGLADLVNAIDAGQVILEFKRLKWANLHAEVIRGPRVEKLIPPQSS